MKNSLLFKQNQSLTNLHFYTIGSLEIKRELLSLLIRSIRELQNNVLVAFELDDVAIYSRAVHKSKSTIAILDNDYFWEAIESLRPYFYERPGGDALKKDLENFSLLCTEKIEYLTSEFDPDQSTGSKQNRA